jgi:predicted nucleic acid-binding protein
MPLPPLPLRERRVFVDSSAYLALLDTDDEHHREAIETLQELAAARYRQFTTNVLLIESHALILSVLGRDRASQFLRDMEESNTVVIRARAADEERAKQILFQYTEYGQKLFFCRCHKLHGDGALRHPACLHL